MSDKDRYTDRHACWYTCASCLSELMKNNCKSVWLLSHTHMHELSHHEFIFTPFLSLMGCCLCFHSSCSVLPLLVTILHTHKQNSSTGTQQVEIPSRWAFQWGKFSFFFSTWGSWESPLSAGSGSHASQAWWGGVARMDIFTPYCSPS